MLVKILKENEMTTKTLICSKVGVNTPPLELTEDEFSALENKSVEDLRKFLESKNFIEKDQEGVYTWRFLELDVNKNDIQSYDARIMGKSSEKSRNLSLLLESSTTRELLLTNTAKEKLPDYMGFQVNWFVNEHKNSGDKYNDLRVKCELSDKTEHAKEINKDKFHPIMLTGVMATSEKNHNIPFNNVCICCKGSALNFVLECSGTLGFWYEAHIGTGKELRISGVKWSDGQMNIKGTTEFWSWSNGDAEIIVDSLFDDPNVAPGDLNPMRVKIIAVDLLSWKNNDTGEIFDESKIAALTPKPQLRTLYRLESDDYSGQTGIDGSDVEFGEFHEGDKQKINYGNWWCEKTGDLKHPANRISIDFFIFKDLETAKKYIDRCNQYPFNDVLDIWGKK